MHNREQMFIHSPAQIVTPHRLTLYVIVLFLAGMLLDPYAE